MFRRIGWALPCLTVLVFAALAQARAGAATNWAVNLAATNSSLTLAGTPGITPTVNATCHSAVGAQIDVSWTAVARATRYVVFQSAGGAAYTQVASVTTTSWSSPNSLALTTYSYKIATGIGTNWVGAQSSASPTHSIVAAVCV